jgi:hypothetical protein
MSGLGHATQHEACDRFCQSANDDNWTRRQLLQLMWRCKTDSVGYDSYGL